MIEEENHHDCLNSWLPSIHRFELKKDKRNYNAPFKGG